MGDGSLSQEEIDALLQGADDLSGTMEMEAAVPAPAFSQRDINTLQGIAGEAAAPMANTLSTITTKTVEINVVQVDVLTKDTFISQFSDGTVQVTADYIEGAVGLHSFIMAEETARQVAALMMAQEEGELTDMALSALTEGFSQMTEAENKTTGGKSGVALKSADLNSKRNTSPAELQLPGGEFVRVRYNFTADGNATELNEIFEINVAKTLVGSELTQMEPSGGFQAGFQPSTFASAPQPQMNVGVQPVQFAPLTQGEQLGVTGNIGLLMDVSMQLTVELGRTKMLIKDILGMGEGTIVELDKLAGEPVDLLVNGKLIAKGEVVVIDENFGVRVTDIISPMERISTME